MIKKLAKIFFVLIFTINFYNNSSELSNKNQHIQTLFQLALHSLNDDMRCFDLSLIALPFFNETIVFEDITYKSIEALRNAKKLEINGRLLKNFKEKTKSGLLYSLCLCMGGIERPSDAKNEHFFGVWNRIKKSSLLEKITIHNFSTPTLLQNFFLLKELHIPNSVFSDSSFLATLSNLKVLDISGVQGYDYNDGQLREPDWSVLQRLIKLKKLYARNTELHLYLPRLTSLQSLQELDISEARTYVLNTLRVFHDFARSEFCYFNVISSTKYKKEYIDTIVIDLVYLLKLKKLQKLLIDGCSWTVDTTILPSLYIKELVPEYVQTLDLNHYIEDSAANF